VPQPESLIKPELFQSKHPQNRIRQAPMTHILYQLFAPRMIARRIFLQMRAAPPVLAARRAMAQYYNIARASGIQHAPAPARHGAPMPPEAAWANRGRRFYNKGFRITTATADAMPFRIAIERDATLPL
jgi:hypothetical protein